MPVKPIPDGYHSIQPYLIIHGAEKALEFYRKAFGAKERLRVKTDDRIHHAEIEIGDSCVMLSDENAQIHAFGPAHYGGSPVTLVLYTEDCDALYKQAIAAGAKSVREPADQFYGDRTATVKDPFGYSWHLSTHIKDVSQAEMEQQA